MDKKKIFVKTDGYCTSAITEERFYLYLHSKIYPLRMTSYIFLNQVHFFAHHGVGGQETIAGNDFIIDLRLKTDIARAAETDDVANTVSYALPIQQLRQPPACSRTSWRSCCNRERYVRKQDQGRADSK